MKICLRRGYHHIFDELINYPPEGIEYVIPKFVTPTHQFGFVNELRRKIWRFYANLFKEPNYIYIPCGTVDLIHSGSGFLVKNKIPWVIDLEHVASLVGFEVGLLEKVKHKVEKILSSQYCKKIMPWTNAAKQSILRGLDASSFTEKIEVVYPAMHPINLKKQKHDKTNLLFVSIRFYTKGGKELLEAYDIIKKKYDVELTVVSDVPKAVREKYLEVKFFEPNISRDKIINDFFPKADIFVLPSYMDTFGMVFLEAMSCQLPIITTNVFTVPEIVGDAGLFVDVQSFSWYGKDYLFAWKSWKEFSNYVEKQDKPKVVEDLVENISTLIEDSSLCRKIGLYGRKQIEKGKFSIKERNKKLKRIYKEAIK